MDLNFKIINEEFENEKVLVVILKFSILTTLKTMVKFDPNPNLKIFYFPNKKFESIPNEIIFPKHDMFIIVANFRDDKL